MTSYVTMCQAKTARGQPCNCKAKSGSDYCGRHKNHYECSICYSVLNKEKTTTKCGHVYCKECITKWLKDHDTCPVCRQPQSQPQLLEQRTTTVEEMEMTYEEIEMRIDRLMRRGRYDIIDELRSMLQNII
jgi:hypothetical protein